MKRQSKLSIKKTDVFREMFGGMLTDLMDERGVTQEALAAATGITQSKISRYARGLNEPKLADFSAICDFFNVAPECFLQLGSPVKPLKSAKRVVDATLEFFGPVEHMLLSNLMATINKALFEVAEDDRPKRIENWAAIIKLMIEKDK